MTESYKIKDLLKNLHFYSSKIKKLKKMIKNFTNNRFLSELLFFPKIVKKFNYLSTIKRTPIFFKKI